MDNQGKFKELLKLIFQFNKDEIDLDFGVYRVFKHKKSELLNFIDELLPQFITSQIQANETEINDAYNDVLEFFGRYYEDGDFYPIPRMGNNKAHIMRHNGEEVIFSWANKDQYYIKSLESFTTYRISDARLFPTNLFSENKGKCVLLQVADVDDIKGDQKKARYYVLNKDAGFHDADGFHVMLDYKVLSKTDAKAQGITAAILHDYLTDKKIHIELENVEFHLNKFQRLRKSDFFIHKNLKRFLLEELDYFVKSEIIKLDGDDYHLRRAIVVKECGAYIIDFLSKLENLQKQLWEKKKFVYDCHYVISLDKLAEYAGDAFVESHAKIILEKQKDEWKSLGMGEFLDVKSLKDKDGGYLPLPVDTKRFDNDVFKWEILDTASKEHDLDEILDGLCVHSDNWQGLNLLQKKYHQKVKCIYIDPPYNTQDDRDKGRFAYKDSFEHSSWLSMMDSRIDVSLSLQHSECAQFISLDENELARLSLLLLESNDMKLHGVFTWRRTRTGGHLSKSFNQLSDYILVSERTRGVMRLYGGQANPDEDQPLYKTTNKIKMLKFPAKSICFKDLESGSISSGSYGNGATYEIKENFNVSEYYNNNEIEISGPFIWNQENLESELKTGTSLLIKKSVDMNIRFLRDPKGHKPFPSLADNNFSVGTNEDASSRLKKLFGENEAKEIGGTPKPVELIRKVIKTKSFFHSPMYVLDYFAGSGTTGHAAIEEQAKFILIESGSHFDNVLLQRLKKVSCSKVWSNGKPDQFDGNGTFFKYHSLEQYEDTLENITLQPESNVNLTDIVEKNEALKPFGNVYSEAMLSILPHVAMEDAKPLLHVEDELLNKPFDFTMRINIDGKPIEKKMDLVETFNTLLGLQVKSVKTDKFEGNHYLFVDAENTAVIWREFEPSQINDNFIAKERTFIEECINLEDKAVYMNGINQVYAINQLPDGVKETLYKFRELLLEGITA